MDTKTTHQPKPGKLDRLWLAVTRAVDQGFETVAPIKPRSAPMRPVQPGYLDVAARPFGVAAGAMQTFLDIVPEEPEDQAQITSIYHPGNAALFHDLL